MEGVRLAVGVAQAIPHREPEPEVAAQAPAPDVAAASPPDAAAPPAFAPSPHARPPRGGMRGAVSRLLRKPAEYARAYLTASLEHQAHLQAARIAEIGGRLERLAPLERQVDALLTETRSLSLRLDEVERRQVRSLAADETQAAAARDVLAVSRDTLTVTTDALAVGRRQVATADHMVQQLDAVSGVLGPRFDELEIKVRPLVELDAESFAVRVADGYVLLPRADPLFAIAVANATSGGLEPGVRRVIRALLRPGDACADVGANVGLLTLAMGYAVGAAGRVWAFEPEARVRAQLARTLHLNGLRQVELSGAAVGREPGRLTFHESPIIGHSSLYDLPEDEQAGVRAVEVEVVTLDGVVPPATALRLVKIDVEGAELDVLAGMARVAADSSDLAVIAEFGPSHLARVGIAPDAWFAAFAAHGLKPRLIAEPGGKTSIVDPAALLEMESANLVFVRPGGEAERRLP